jgi:hypothetical protein
MKANSAKDHDGWETRKSSYYIILDHDSEEHGEEQCVGTRLAKVPMSSPCSIFVVSFAPKRRLNNQSTEACAGVQGVWNQSHVLM